MPYHFKPFQFYRFFFSYSGFSFGDCNLVFHRIYAFQIRKQQTPFAPFGNDNAISCGVKLVWGGDFLFFPKHVHADG